MKLCLVVYPLEIVRLIQALTISCSRLPPPPQSTNLDQGPGKKDTFFTDRKEEKKKGRKEGGKEGKKRRERKEEGVEERRKERKEAKKGM